MTIAPDSRVEEDMRRVEADEQRLARDLGRLEHDLKSSPVRVTVNRHAVTLAHHRTTGLQIKEAAIAAGVPIDTGFQLDRDLTGGHAEQIGDNQAVEVHEGDRFTAIASDDNS